MIIEDFQVAGWLLEGGMLGHGGLMVGLPDPARDGLRPMGLIETGFGPEGRGCVFELIARSATDRSPFIEGWRPENVVFTNARLVARVQHLATDAGLLRHSALKGIAYGEAHRIADASPSLSIPSPISARGTPR